LPGVAGNRSWRSSVKPCLLKAQAPRSDAQEYFVPVEVVAQQPGQSQGAGSQDDLVGGRPEPGRTDLADSLKEKLRKAWKSQNAFGHVDRDGVHADDHEEERPA